MKIARRQLGLFILLFAVSSLLVHSPPEAFADVGDITAVRSQSLGNHFTMETKASWNSFVHVDEDTYALAHQNRAGTGAGSISTFTISSDGDTITALDTLQHTAFRGTYNSLVRVDSDTVALAFTGADGNGFITTFTIDSNGNITKVDTLEHDTYQSSTSYNTLLHVNSDMYALAYERSDTNLISTVTIDSDGNITAVKTQSEGNNFNLNNGAEQGYGSLVKVDSDTVALAHSGRFSDGFITTFTIDSNGNITQVDALEHDTTYGRENSLVQVDSDTYALSYKGTGGGYISTFTIDSGGNITAVKTQSEGNNFQYHGQASDAYSRSLVNMDSDTYALAHGSSAVGIISTFTISSDGETITALDSLEHDADYAVRGSVVKVNSYTVAFAYHSGHLGEVSTFTIGDSTSPTVTITSSTGSSGDTVSDTTLSYTATFSESTSNFVVGDITVTGTANDSSPAASNFAGSGTTYTFDVVKGSSDGTVSVSVAADKATDASGNDNTVSNTYALTIDSTSPTVTITSSTGDSGDTVSDTTLSYTATFSESTSNFVVGDITVTGTANDSSPVASNFAGSGTTYTFDVVKGSSDGTVSVSVAAGKATDAAGNDNTVSNTYTFTIDTTVTSSGASTQGTSCFASPRCAIISVPDGFSINEKSYTLFKNTHTLPTYEAIVGQPVTITLKIPVTSELLQIMSTTIYVEIFNSFEDYEDAARIKYSLTDETIQYTNQSIFEVVGAKNESKLIKLSKDYPENVPESQIPAINFVEITFTMIFAKPMDTSHVVIETEGNYNMHEIIYLRDALVVKENSLNALTLDEVSKIKPELVYDPLPFVDPLKEPSHYIKRYLSEPEYKEWFDTNYPSYTIYEGIGISKFEFDEIVKQLTSPEPSLNNYQGSIIPEWVKNNAAWWSEGVIYDNDFVSGIEFLIKEGVIMVSVTESGEKSDAVIPEWVKNNAAWWSEDIISEKEFLSGIEYLVNNGIIQVN